MNSEAGRVVESLKKAVDDENPELGDALTQFQGLLESVGTPESIKSTLDYLKHLKIHLLLHFVRTYARQQISLDQLTQLLRQTMDLILIKKSPPEKTETNRILYANDQCIYHRFRTFINDLSSLDSKPQELIEQLVDTDFPLEPFRQRFCGFLDRILQSLEAAESSGGRREGVPPPPPRPLNIPPEATVDGRTDLTRCRLNATDMLHVVNREMLQAIHKGEDSDLVDFLAHHQMMYLFPEAPLSELFPADEPFALALPALPERSLLNTSRGSTFETPASMQSKLKRKRPHEDIVGSAGKRRAISTSPLDWASETVLPEPTIDPLNSLAPPPLTRTNIFSLRECVPSPRRMGFSPEDENELQELSFEAPPIERIEIPSLTLEKPPKPPKPGRREGTTRTGQRKRKRWSDREVNQLLEGVRLFGSGYWKDILKHFDFGDRTYVDLKDKFRNLLKHYSMEELMGRVTPGEFTTRPSPS